MFRDFEPIILGSRFELAFNVHPSVRANNVKQWVACVKGNPAGATLASRGAGTSSHFLGEIRSEAAAIKMTHVPYRSLAGARFFYLASPRDAGAPQPQRWVRNMNTPAPTSSTMPPQASAFGMSPHTAQPSTSANSKPE